jgi:hypothetical protein
MTPSLLLAWGRTPLAQRQPHTRKAVGLVAGGRPAQLGRTRRRLAQLVTQDAFASELSLAPCLVAVDRALGAAANPIIDGLVDAAFSAHGGDLVAMATVLLRGLHDFSSALECLLRSLPLSPTEERFVRRAYEEADVGDSDAFVQSAIDAADYMADDLEAGEDGLADRAFLVALLWAFGIAEPMFDPGARARLLLALGVAGGAADAEQVKDYVCAVVAGASVRALDRMVVRTRHLPLLRAFVAEAPEGLEVRARVLLTELRAHGADRWSKGGMS